jgi:hypothetical protein
LTTLRLSTICEVRSAAALTLLIGRDTSYVYALSAVDYHVQTLRYLWLIHSSDETSMQGAEKIEAYAVLKSPGARIFKRPIRDLFSVEEAKRTIELIRKEATRFGISSADFISDFTGMSKPVSAGVVLACIRPEYRLQYMEPRGFLADGRPDPKAGARPVEIDVNYDVDLV